MTQLEVGPRIALSHPSQPGWRPEGISGVDKGRRIELRDGLQLSNEGIEPVVDALAVASRRTDVYRLTHEKENIQKLELTESEHASYVEFASCESSKANLVGWFSLKAQELFDSKGADAPEKVVIELGGVQQASRWQSGELDAVLRRLPGDLRDSYCGASMLIYEDGPAVEKKYKQLPLLLPSSELAAERLKFITVRRRRPVADAVVKNGHPLQISKESTALVIVDKLPADKRRIMRLEAIYEEAGVTNAPTAVAAGWAFEDGIMWHGKKQEDFTVLPIGAHYVMAARREDRSTHI